MRSFQDQISSIQASIEQQWEQDILPVIEEYIAIPNKSPRFDRAWEANGYMDKAMNLILSWCQRQSVQYKRISVERLPGRTPLLFIEIEGSVPNTVLLYGHMDKQPEMVGWDADKGPWKPVRIGDKLYGRGGADDGYSAFAVISAIGQLQQHGIAHPRCVVLIEGSEESGSMDLPAYLEHLQNVVGTPELVICLDSGAGNYDQLWQTTSLRGSMGGVLSIEVLTEGIHSGMGSGIVPGCAQVLRQLLDRVENPETGEMLLPELKAEIPADRLQQAEQAAEILDQELIESYPFVKGVKPISSNKTELLLNRTWRSFLSWTGMEGLPTLENAGNVTIPKLSMYFSVRLPPTCDAEKASAALKRAFEQDPPCNAKVSYSPEAASGGWNAPSTEPWLASALDMVSNLFFGKPSAAFGEGGTIPFMGMLAKQYPEAQFFITGVLGPRSNAHGPNEFLHIPMVKKLTGCVAGVLAAFVECC